MRATPFAASSSRSRGPSWIRLATAKVLPRRNWRCDAHFQVIREAGITS
jgi:hypothetical protein